VVAYISTKTTNYSQGVWTQTGFRSTSTVRAYIDLYRSSQLGPLLDGFFIDEVSNRWQATETASWGDHTAYYRSLFAEIRGLDARYVVVANPGSLPPDGLLNASAGGADTAVIFEGSLEQDWDPTVGGSTCLAHLWTQQRGSFAPGPWCPYVPGWDGVDALIADAERGFGAVGSELAALIYGASAATIGTIHIQALAANVTSLYASTSRKWDDVPSWWCQAIGQPESSTCVAAPPQPPPPPPPPPLLPSADARGTSLIVAIVAPIAAAVILLSVALLCWHWHLRPRKQRDAARATTTVSVDVEQMDAVVVETTGDAVANGACEAHRSGSSSCSSGAAPDSVRLLQNSFCARNSMQMMKFRDMVDSYTDRWRFLPLLMPGVDDPTWFERWQEGLNAASGVLVLFTGEYRERANSHVRSALRMEAAAIKERLARDPNFKLFALDPSKEGQGYGDLRLYLDAGETYMNKSSWLAFINVVDGLDGALPTGEYISENVQRRRQL